MKVFIAPDAGRRNPYQKLLVSSLERAGLDVEVARGFFLPWGQILKEGLPDVIHLQWQHKYFKSRRFVSAVLRTLLFYLQWWVLSLLGVRFVWTVHNVINHEKLHPGWELLACRLLARLVDSLIVHCAAAIPTVASAYRVSPGRFQVVPHGHYANWYPPPPDKSEARSRLGLSPDARIFLFFGQIIRPYKGLDRLMTAFAGLKTETVRLILLGEPRPAAIGPPLAAQAAGDPRVTTHFEFIDDDDLVAYLSACDLVVLPYRDALTSGAAVLAASYGRPVLVPNLGCMREFPPQAALTYQPAEAGSLRLALEQALSAPLPVMGQAAKRYIEQFSWARVAAGTVGVYEQALGPKLRLGVRIRSKE